VRGKFITLEGMDGAGKSTHIPTIIAALESAGHRVVSTREPGGTSLGEHLREILLHEAMHPETEALLMFAARRQHIAEVIEPALSEGAYVVSDRFSDASFAYQHGARGVDAGKILQLEAWVHPHLQPDLTILFDVPVEVSIARLANARRPDKFEQQDAEFFTRIRNAYLQRAAESPERFRVVDGNQPITLVEQSLLHIIADL
jgi:dTMP kinase